MIKCQCILLFIPYYIYPISDFLLYPSHTPLFISYSATSCEGCEGTSFTPAGGAARYASTCRLVFESQELTDIQEDVGLVKDRFIEFLSVSWISDHKYTCLLNKADVQYNQFGMGTDTISRSGTTKAG